MDRGHPHNDCAGCPGRLVCHCLQVTEAALVEALEGLGLRTLKEVRRHTGAGDGCTACHKLLGKYLERHGAQPCSPALPICSVR
jgi:NAD(P)H-nitrite reductase large subunit